MKKSIGLAANTSDFRPNLPQTRHLNYFMGTNPVYMAGGGDVKAGIPNYPDVNVTRGFLPAALGFDNGGEATGLEFFKNLLRQFDNDFTKLLNFLQNILGFSEEKSTDIINQITGEEGDAAKFQGSEQGKAIADAFDYAGQGSGQSTGAPTVTPKDTVTDLDDELTEHLRKLNLIGMGGYYGAPPATSQITPGIGPRLETSPGESSGAPQDTGGITEIPQKELGFKESVQKDLMNKDLDLNGDGVVDWRDLALAAKQGSWDIWEKIQKYIKGFTEGDQEEKIITKEEDRIAPKADEIWPTPTEPKPDEQVIPKPDEQVIPKPDEQVIPKPDGGGIAGIDTDYLGKGLTTTEDEALGQDEQALFKATTGDTKGKKDVPAWALPLMSAGFAMMASKSPYFMQALGEGGQKGLETFTGMKEAKTAKEKYEAETELAKAQAAYARGEGRQTGKGTYVHNGMLYKADGSPLYLDTPDKGKIHAPASLSFKDAAVLAPKYYGTQWDMMDENQRTQATFALMEMYKNQAAGMTPSAPDDTPEDKGPGIFEKGWKYGKGFFSKDGGIVSLRR